MAGYSVLDRILHRAALQALPIAELSFELDQKMVRSDPKDIVGDRHVFVAGLARAGTTILMRRFHATGEYCSLTYRDMPFVLAPNLWRKLANLSRRTIAAAERAHGDRILVDIDSPESLDEVFWRILDGDAYIGKSHLAPHEPDEETARKYVGYVNAILNARGREGARYLSKNNNNILRLATIRRLFPNALILVPFRDPLTHAGSLLRQQRNFVATQQDDRFAMAYMTWLVHHEFGLDHRPFRFDADGAARLAAHDPDRIDYWLELWCQTHAWLERNAPEGAIFVCYEDLCRSGEVWDRLAALAGIGDPGGAEESFSLSQAAHDTTANAALVGQANALYGRLVERARDSLR
ncbi:sulfotransferase [Oceanibacterium hippocampi]|uniref:Sulfotransferase domain protein n=1 Tax=Oceanibacterium hippocampi TaxID=745714 RepID=A0A1Y5TUV5_9PROT|nr:sulfotransferase [Oceanibacterium hippocampi]SLN70773.1 hypothetical protein OCH7691_03318 [Oceanibacterium hippocampi]